MMPAPKAFVTDECPFPVVQIPAYMTWIWSTLTLLCVLPLFVTVPFYIPMLHLCLILITVAVLIRTIYAGRHRILYVLRNGSRKSGIRIQWPDEPKDFRTP